MKDEEREEEEKHARDNRTKTESVKKSKKGSDDPEVEGGKRMKKPNPKITRIKVGI